jgi:hypothetical protein
VHAFCEWLTQWNLASRYDGTLAAIGVLILLAVIVWT